MDRRKAATALGGALPGLLWWLVPIVGGTNGSLHDSLAFWAPVILIVVGLGGWAIYWVFIEPHLHPTSDELRAALDKMIDYDYKEDSDGNPRAGLSGEGVIREHAPAEVRARWWDKLGLGKPPVRPDKYG